MFTYHGIGIYATSLRLKFPNNQTLPCIPTKLRYAAAPSPFHHRRLNATDANSTTTSPEMNHSSYTSNNSSILSSSSSTSNNSNNSSEFKPDHGLIGSLFREEGHVYSLATAGNFLYTGSESKNVRVWKNFKEFSGFKSASGMVKAIVVFNEKIFTGHQDGKIRVWTFLDDKRSRYNRVGNLPETKHLLLKSLSPRNYIEVRRKRYAPWIKHYDTVSCMNVDAAHGLLYSGSWDKTLKIWRISDSKCLESIPAHDDAVNSTILSSDGMVFTGSADGTVKAWRREFVGKRTEHFLVEILLKQDHAVTALAASPAAVYAGSSDGLVRFWEVEKRFMAYGGVMRGHKMAVLCLVVAGNLVMSGSADKSICVWRRGGGGQHDCAVVLTGHDGPVKCLAVEKETLAEEEEEEGKGRRRWIVYSGSLDNSVKIWRVFE